MKLSIIVPIRNGEAYLEQCIESILNQSFKDFELILVNNASKDKSQEIIESYAKRDNRIIALKAGGLQVNEVRKIGLDHATGEYIGFVDCDDWIDLDMYDVLVSECDKNKLDMVSSGMTHEIMEKRDTMDFPDNVPYRIYDKEDMEKNIYPYMLYRPPFFTNGIQPSIWNKVYRKELLIPIFNEIDMDILYGEDGLVVYSALLNSNRVEILERSFYHYRIHGKSNTYTAGKELITSAYNLFKEFERVFKSSRYSDELMLQLKYFMLSTELFNLNRIYGINIYEMMDWGLPFRDRLKNSSVAIWGAGDVGHSFKKYVEDMNDVKLVYWIDSKRYMDDPEVDSPEVLKNSDLDYIIIAVKNENVAQNIREMIRNNGYEDNQVLWANYEKRFPFM